MTCDDIPWAWFGLALAALIIINVALGNIARAIRADNEMTTIEKAISYGEDATGLCTVRDIAVFLHVIELKTIELCFEHEGKRYNVLVTVIKVTDL